MPSAAHPIPVGDPDSPRGEKLFELFRVAAVNLAFAALTVGVIYSLVVTHRTKQQETLQKRGEVEAARLQLNRDVAINDDLKRQIRFLRTEEGVEKVARERLGLVRPNERSYVVVNAPATLSRPRPRPTPSSVEPSPAAGVGTQAWRLVVGLWNGGE